MNSFYDILDKIPHDFINFLLITAFALMIGLEQRSHHVGDSEKSIFGTDRTYTLIGILGFLMYKLNSVTLIPFLVGIAILGLILTIYYYNKLLVQNKDGITSILVALITYNLTPFVYTQPPWMAILLVVVVLIIVEVKKSLFEFSKKIDNKEFITLAKFLIMAGVVLPLLPDEPISPVLNFSPYKLWLAIVVVSGISYGSYLLKKFVFPKSGIVLTGILGGMYSSTATTFILAKKSKELNDKYKIAAAIIFATSMMFIRIFVLALVFNESIAFKLAPSFSVLFVLSVFIGIYMLWIGKKEENDAINHPVIDSYGNPLEFNTALVFGGLFIFFALLTGYVTQQFGAKGIKILSYIVGVTDIDPFIINIFQSKFNVAENVLVIAVINAVTSNNVLKMIYALILSSKSIHRFLIIGFGILILAGLFYSFFI